MYANDDVRYALNRLLDTIIRYNGKAVLVTNVTFVSPDQPLRVHAFYIVEEHGENEIKDFISKFDLTPVPLGFINFPEKKQASYLSRIPIREDWRQGLRQANSRTMWGQQWWGNQQIANTIENNFPTLEKARSYCKGEQTCAWTRDFAVDGGGHIYYRCEGVVGEFIDDTNNYVLNAEYGWVEESLKEALTCT